MPSIIPKSLSALDMLKMGKVVKKTRYCKTFIIESFDTANTSWKNIGDVEFNIEGDIFEEGGFREAYEAHSSHPIFRGQTWLIKISKKSCMETVNLLNDTVEEHTRKSVQMHMLAMLAC